MTLIVSARWDKPKAVRYPAKPVFTKPMPGLGKL